MKAANQVKNDEWVDIDRRLRRYESSLPVPNNALFGVPSVELRDESDLEEIPEAGGCYWIWTNEPVRHSLHSHPTPRQFRSGEVIYNGIAQDNIRGRIRNHLFADVDSGWSAISMDLLLTRRPPRSHRKRAMSTSRRVKVPFVDSRRISSINVLKKLRLTRQEKEYIEESRLNNYHFRNGIRITEHKHRRFRFKVYFIVQMQSLTYLNFIEKHWRRLYHQPKLCSYSSGR